MPASVEEEISSRLRAFEVYLPLEIQRGIGLTRRAGAVMCRRAAVVRVGLARVEVG
jgi:hypothetical protein